MTGRRRWGFRARLAALIAGVFIFGGVVLLGVQYLLVQQLFAQGISTITAGCLTNDTTAAECSIETGDGGEIVIGGGEIGSVAIAQTTQLSEEVLSGLLTWSIVILVAFAGVAVLAAWWLSRRSLERIARITATAREITREGLHRRLDLPGPRDELTELGDTIDGMLDRLDDAFERQDRFIAGASHELRTPLTTTRTLLEIPLAQGRVPAELTPAVRGALEANERSERIIAALLTLARSTQASAEVAALPVDLSELVRASLDERASETASRGVTVDAPDASVLVVTDAELVRIAVGNLVENAIRHNLDHGRIRITTASDDAVRLRIENDGRELTGDEVARLTEPFHRGERTRLAGSGTGLGLTLADTIARALGGSLELAPRALGGLVATLTLPHPRAAES
ncbi:sensor histidine kinase [Microbacterium sp.]|uniref:sensor histidine kinase n=1 Tax=Microbacterium sp. TaxID=51671 RepID=UPI0039E269A1